MVSRLRTTYNRWISWWNIKLAKVERWYFGSSECNGAAHRISKQQPRRMRVWTPSRNNSWTNYCNANYYVLMFTSENKTNAEIKWVFITTKTKEIWWRNGFENVGPNLSQVLLHRPTSQPYFYTSVIHLEMERRERKLSHSHKRINNLREQASGNKTQTKSAGWATQHKLEKTMAKSEKKKY